MAERLWIEHQAPAWLDGSPGGPVRVWLDVVQQNRIASARLEVVPGVVGQITIVFGWDGQEYVYVTPNITSPLVGYGETKNIPGAAQITWVDNQLIADDQTYSGPIRNGLPPYAQIGWTNPDGVMTTAQRAAYEQNRGG